MLRTFSIDSPFYPGVQISNPQEMLTIRRRKTGRPRREAPEPDIAGYLFEGDGIFSDGCVRRLYGLMRRSDER